MAKKYVPDGVYLVCNKGLGFCKLKVTNHKSVSLFGNNSATEADKLPNVNIGCMGVCSVTKSICQPLPTLWSGVQESITIGPYRKLLEDSKLGCALGGQISIYFTLPDAMSAINKNSSAIKSAGIKNIGAKVDDWFQKQFDAQEKINNAGPLSGLANFKLGLSEGIYGGVKGIGEGLVFLGELENKVIDAGIDAALHPVKTAGKIKDAVIATKDATGKAYDWVTNEDNLKKTAEAVGEAHRNAYNWVTTPGNLQGAAKTALTKTGEGLKQAKDWAVKQNPRDWGRYTGRGGFEAALMFTGVGEVKAVVSGAEAVNVASKVGEGANVVAKIGEGANVLSKGSEAVNLAEKVTEGANLLNKGEKGRTLGEVVSTSTKKVKLIAGTAEHKAARWAAYEKRGGKWSYERWSKQYDVNMKNATYGLQREQAYRDILGGNSKTVKTPHTNRQIDIFNESKDYMGQLKTGKLSLTEQVKLDILKDKTLIDKGFNVEYILEKGASKPCLEALKDAGIKVHIGPKIPL
ncbi:PAAR-like protein [Pedobacter sp. UYP1]|uniref:PAAR-like protein n=1 Tax=Pedobacter sp. UYP1 TaxID=1756396 RepID=UPI003398697A